MDILVVDDDPGIATTLCQILLLKKHDVETAANGNEAVALIKKKHFDMAIVDIVMPELNGIDTYNQIKEISPDTNVVMITG